MKLSDALNAISDKEGEGTRRADEAKKKADKIRFSGEEKATEVYRKTRETLKDKAVAYRKDWEKRLGSLDDSLSKKGEAAIKQLTLKANNKRKAAAKSAYDMLVRFDEGTS